MSGIDALRSAPDPHAQTDPKVVPAEPMFDGRYILLSLLGQGGMGTVHVAYDVQQLRKVALKRIFPAQRGNRGFIERFRREYRALAAIRHRGVPALFHSGTTADGVPFYTMEIVRGVPLRAALEQGRLADLRALSLAIDLGRILIAVHQAGIVHRDIKPSNIMIESGDQVRLIDFGACHLDRAFFLREEVERVTDTVARWVTSDLDVIGTPGYTDPELLRGEATTSVRSDVYSVCAILYEMLTGRHLFDHEAHRYRSIRAEEFALDLAGLVPVLLRGTADEAIDRHKSMAELVQELEVVRSAALRLRASDPPPAPARHLALMGVTAVMALLAGVTIFSVLRRSFAAPADDPTAATLLAAAVRQAPGGATVAATPPGVRPPATHLATTAQDAPSGPASDATLVDPPIPPEAPPDATTAALATATAVSAAPATDPASTDPAAPATDPAAVHLAPAPAAPPRLSATHLAPYLERAGPAVRACRPGAEIDVELTVQRGRAIVRALNSDAFDPATPLHRCVAQALATVRFPRSSRPFLHAHAFE